MIEISTSILSVKEEDSVKTFYNLETAKTDYFHIDVMDGKFVENNTSKIMQKYSEKIKQISNTPLDVHLMVDDVNKYIEEYIPIAPSYITFHVEACKNKQDVFKCIEKIKKNNIKVGISLKPQTSIEEIYEFLPYIHLVLIMTVEPGKGGQKLISYTLDKIKDIKKYIENNSLDTYIEADGGINLETAKDVINSGADILVSGSAIINADNYKKVIEKMRRI